MSTLPNTTPPDFRATDRGIAGVLALDIPKADPSEPPVDNAEFGLRKDTARILGEALRAAEIRSLCDVGRTPRSPALTLVLLANDDDSTAFPDSMAVPDRSAASVLKHALHSIGVEVGIVTETIGPEPALRVELSTCGDALLLTQWIMDHLPAPHDAAHHLRAAFASRGIEAKNVRATRTVVTVGRLSVQDAAALRSTLHEAKGADLDLDDDWRSVDYLAARTGAVLSAATGNVVNVLADPACSTCARSRPHSLDIGDITVSAARRLIAAMSV
ncbi:hypothetical protein [Streptomyces sp. NPDC096013]|uniref:hypothetical protein n=1 Tax=Streptomyces sp. NPDC096013 TaxID=3366069 RepID=UPI0038230A1A